MERSSESKDFRCICEAIIVGDTSAYQVYQIVSFEDEYVFTIRDLTFSQKGFSQVVTTRNRIF
jgi:hypothetical protein